MFGRKWVKKEELRRLEAVAENAFKRMEPVCREMEAEYGPKVEEKGFKPECRPSPYGESIRAVVSKHGSACAICFPGTEQVKAILPDSFRDYEVSATFTTGARIEPVYVSPEIMRRTPGEIMARPLRFKKD